MTAILGISAFYHDSAAALVIDGELVAAAQQERFTRRKHDPEFPDQAIEYCLRHAGIGLADLDHVGFYEKPLLKFDRQLETYFNYAPVGLRSFRQAMPQWTSGKLAVRREILRGLSKLGVRSEKYRGRICFCEHHESHAASAFFLSPFEHAAILTMDGVGEWATASRGRGHGNQIELDSEIHFPDSLGLLYSAFTYYCGFRVNDGEYKLMGLAPYGEPKYVDTILDRIIHIFDDGSFSLDQSYFQYCQGLTMTSEKFHRLFGRPPRNPDAPIEPLDMDLAASIQRVTEEVVIRAARQLHAMTDETNLCMAGGVALNCVANGRLLREGPFDQIWIQPAAGDAGGAIGTAMLIWHQLMNRPRSAKHPDAQHGSLLGPGIDRSQLDRLLVDIGAVSRSVRDEQHMADEIAAALDQGKVVGRVHGRMEFGPRALGNRSILADPRRPDMQSRLNQKIKFRESFRPFAPAVHHQHSQDIFDLPAGHDSPYMLLVSHILPQHRIDVGNSNVKGLERLKLPRSRFPAITHVDYSARIQTVDPLRNDSFLRVIESFNQRSNCPLVVNTSMNVRDEPIVCDQLDALACFTKTGMDVLAIEHRILEKSDQPDELLERIETLLNRRAEETQTTRETSMFVAGVIAAVALFAIIVFLKWQAAGFALSIALADGLLAAIAWIRPTTRPKIRRGFEQLTFPLRCVVTWMIVAMIYYGVVTPIGVIRRWLGHGLQSDSPSPNSRWRSRSPRELPSYFEMF